MDGFDRFAGRATGNGGDRRNGGHKSIHDFGLQMILQR
jgi:hypothetical protein